MPETRKLLNRTLTNLHHGDHAVVTAGKPDDAVPAEAASLEAVIQESAPVCLDDATTPFGYLFPELAAAYPAQHLPVEPSTTVVNALKALGSAMVDQPGDPEASNSSIPPVYTYWGQFVDHDVTANTDRDGDVSIQDDPLTPIEPKFVPALVRNLREPALNLDSVYGNGPGDPVIPYVGAKLEEGFLSAGPPVPVPGGDVPRTTAAGTTIGGKARIGDSRNDENLIVQQLHTAFLRFHNHVVDYLAANEPELTDDQALFERARQLTRWHYQAIVVEDFLRTVAQSAVVDDVLANPVADKVRKPDAQGTPEVFMPLEHSVAAYRFGHSMVRAQYDHNENFGRPHGGGGANPDPDDPDPDNRNRATFAQMFLFTGNGVIQDPQQPGQPFSLKTFPDNWPIRWRRFTDKGFPDRFARKIDTHLSPPLTDLSNEGNLNADGTPQTDLRIQRILKRLAVRNLLRGYRLGLPTGQAVAAALGVTPLTEVELTRNADGSPNAVGDALVDGGFVDATPLWCYVLREAEVKEDGERLGEVGSRIICTTLIGQIQADEESFLNRSGGAWSTAEGVKLAGGGEVNSIKTFLEFAEVLDFPAAVS